MQPKRPPHPCSSCTHYEDPGRCQGQTLTQYDPTTGRMTLPLPFLCSSVRGVDDRGRLKPDCNLFKVRE